ncbi:ROK family protein [Hyphobacterium sp.]|uniref:ROK family protein n=1 Tax=Hyphobacterium sp. TaxID=2004662 RepID=UPI003749D711
MIRIGVDLGGTKTEVAAIDSDGHTRYSVRDATPEQYESKIRLIAALVQRTEETLQSDSLPVGIGHPGSLSPVTGLIRNSNSASLNGRALDKDLAAALNRPVRCANDANCFALSEAIDGAGQGATSVFGAILGTGVGGGLVLNNSLHEGHGLLGGEWGHTSLPWPTAEEVPGPLCKCGLTSCIESWISGPALSADHQRHSGESLTGADIHERAREGDAVAAASLDRFQDRLARGLATIINIVDPEVFVLGGGLSNMPNLAEETRQRLPQYVFSDQVTTRILRNTHGDSSGVRGAAWLWPLT